MPEPYPQKPISDINYDIYFRNNLYKINKNTLAIFVTHAMGFSGISHEFLRFIKDKEVENFLYPDFNKSAIDSALNCVGRLLFPSPLF